MSPHRLSNLLYFAWGVLHVGVGARTLSLAKTRSASAALDLLADRSSPHHAPPELEGAVGALAKQHGWNLMAIGGTAATIAAVLGRRNPRAARTANLALVSLADLGFIAAFLAPGRISPRVGLPGPLLWIGAALAGAVAQRHALRPNA